VLRKLLSHQLLSDHNLRDLEEVAETIQSARALRGIADS